MNATTPSTTSRASAAWRRSPRPAAAVASAAIAVVVALSLAGPAGAQSSTTLAPTTTMPGENPGSTAGSVVFFGVCGVILVGALVLFLRNRRPRVTSTEP
jgi:hypothetical protein